MSARNVLPLVVGLLLAGCADPVQPDPARSFSAFETVPANPTNVTGTAITQTQIDLAWNDNANNETRYTVQRRISTAGTWSNWNGVQAAGANLTMFSDMNATSGSPHQYRVRACNATGCSAWALSRPIWAEIAPGAPASLVATVVSSVTISIEWDNVSGESYFTLQRSAKAGGVWGAWQTIANRPENNTSWADFPLTAGTTYRYRVRACNVAGCSPWILSNRARTLL